MAVLVRQSSLDALVGKERELVWGLGVIQESKSAEGIAEYASEVA